MKILLFANTDWYLYNFRRSLAVALRDAGHEVLLVSPPGDYSAKLVSLGFRWLPAPLARRSLNPLRELGLLIWLWRLILRERPAIVHGFTIKCAVYGALAGRLAGASRVSAVAGLGYVFTSDAFKARALRPFVRALMAAAFGGVQGRVILQNPDDAHFFKEAGMVAPEHIRMIPGSGVDCAAFRPRATHALRRPESWRVVMASRMLWDKGVGEFVEAARLLKAQGRAVRFILAGAPDGGNPASVEQNVLEAWARDGVIEWVGHVDDMATLFANSDVVVLPSYREGLPKSLIEAGACGLPIVTTDVPGCREVVTDGVDGLVVSVRNAGALAAAIARLQDDPALARRLGDAARRKALEQFDERVVIARTINVYMEVAATDATRLDGVLIDPVRA